MNFVRADLATSVRNIGIEGSQVRILLVTDYKSILSFSCKLGTMIPEHSNNI